MTEYDLLIGIMRVAGFSCGAGLVLLAVLWVAR